MAKSLGQIHTVNYEISNVDTGRRYLLDNAGELANQLGRQVRMMSTFKLCGIDITLDNLTSAATINPVPVSGTLKYYSPTKGRCDALRNAYYAMMDAMNDAGVARYRNKNYDFRPLMSPQSLLDNGSAGAPELPKNLATYNGLDVLVMGKDGVSGYNDRADIFGVWNEGIQPRQTATPDFKQGFGTPFFTQGGSTTITPSDFVSNEGLVFDPTDAKLAMGDYEEIPFTVTWGYDGANATTAALEFQWQPDPMLYLSILTGQVILEIDEFPLSSAPAANLKLNVAFHFSGWKSILSRRSNHWTRRPSKRSSKSKKSKGRK